MGATDGESRPFLLRAQSTFVPASLVLGAAILGFSGRSILQAERDDNRELIERSAAANADALKLWKSEQDSRWIQWQEKQDVRWVELQNMLGNNISQMRGELAAQRDASARVEASLAVQASTLLQLAFASDVRLWAADIARENPGLKIPPFIPTEGRR
ncbi:MAG TPA: hypothetical protein VFD43_00270 [Planctomycetota bacterium]|nr:hypothetical protein [Planctomycetota bacterium]